ncbi:MAG: hypothetical protein AAGK02_09075 [Pseudomonadota bacterium]
MTEAKKEERDELRAKIEARERRIAERTLGDSAKEAADAAVNYTREHPLKVVGGAIIIGVLIGLMTKPGRRAAGAATSRAAGFASNVTQSAATAAGNAADGAKRAVGGVAKKRSAAVGSLIADAIIAYGIKFIDEAMSTKRAGQDLIEDAGDTATAKARELRREAGFMAGTAADKTRSVSRKASRTASRAMRDIKGKVVR